MNLYIKPHITPFVYRYKNPISIFISYEKNILYAIITLSHTKKMFQNSVLNILQVFHIRSSNNFTDTG